MSDVSDPVGDVFRVQAAHCAALDSPFMVRLMTLAAERLGEDTATGARVHRMAADPAGTGDLVPLRWAGGLHALVLSGRAPELARAYPPDELDLDDDGFWARVQAAMADHDGFLHDWLDSPPQTNEVRRCAVLVPGFLTVAARTGLPLVLSELGASGGLNLAWDRYGYRFGPMRWGRADSAVQLSPDWDGPLPPDVAVQVAARTGCDLNPLDPRTPEDRERLIAYLWPDQAERIVRTRAAADIAGGADARLDRADAARWLAERLATPCPGQTHVVFHSIAWQYFPAETQAACRAALERAGSEADETTPLAWLRMEADGDSAALDLTLWPGGQTFRLARTGFHGQWVTWYGIG